MRFDPSKPQVPPEQADAQSFDELDVGSMGGNTGPGEEEGKEPPMAADFPPYRESIFETAAYKWLHARIDRALLLELTGQSAMDQFDHIIGKKLMSQTCFNDLSRKRAPNLCKMTFEVHWDPISFIAEQGYDGDAGEAFERAITLTGTADNAQALTCAQYLSQTWPVTGPETVEVIKAVIRRSRHSRKSENPIPIIFLLFPLHISFRSQFNITP